MRIDRYKFFGIWGFVIVLFTSLPTMGQQVEAYPSNWFVQMKMNKVQVLLRAPNSDLTKSTVNLNYPGVKINNVHHFKNGHYIAVDIEIANAAKPGDLHFIITTQGENINKTWALLPRRVGRGSKFAQGVNSADLVYFLMPDRFSNGDPSNDRVAGLKDQSLNRLYIFKTWWRFKRSNQPFRLLTKIRGNYIMDDTCFRK